MKVLALGGSVRAVNPRSSDALMRHIAKTSSIAEFAEAVRADNAALAERGITRPILSNSEILSGIALIGAKGQGASVDYFPLARLFNRLETPVLPVSASELGLDDEAAYVDTLSINPAKRALLLEKIAAADAIILSSPIYFGDRSSVSNKVLQIAQAEGSLKGKLVATLSVGAKRNGGQETTNIFTLNEVVHMGGMIVGNGPSSCQYGGTAIAGDAGTILKDEWGMETAFATGKRVAQAASVLTTAIDPSHETAPIEIMAIVTMDMPQRILAETLRAHQQSLLQAGHRVNLSVVQLIDGYIERCLACNICPIPELMKSPKDYGCIIQSGRDIMKDVREQMLASDGIIIAGLNLRDMRNVVYRYQAFTERTRFIRRNDFELTNVPLTSFTLEEVGGAGNDIFGLKVMTSYIRHNTIVCPPISEILHEGQTIKSALPEMEAFVRTAGAIAAKRRAAARYAVSYKAGGHGGYSDTRLDSTEAMR